ncbi:TPA: hypothetical protein ACKQA3_000661 [Pseudomonas aeruginosa]
MCSNAIRLSNDLLSKLKEAGGGRCVAGKIPEGQYRNYWIRPVAPRQNRTITLDDQAFYTGEHPDLLDLINVTYTGVQLGTFQQENHVIDDRTCWEYVGQFNRDDLHTLVDNPAQLWETSHDDSYSGVNDRIAGTVLTQPRQSLYLIEPENVRIHVSAEGAQWNDHRLRVRAFFDYNGIHYGLMVTDLEFETEYIRLGAGWYDADDISYFTVSLGEIDSHGYAYKLVAAVF